MKLAALAMAVVLAGCTYNSPQGNGSPIPSKSPAGEVGVVVTKQPAPAPPACDPNYSGCVPVASDVDCAGGKGNGPEYVRGPVYVTGSDIYGLDGDGDGVGCER